MDKKHLFEKGNKRCVIVRSTVKISLPKPSCCDKNNQCENQLRRQMCKRHWSELLRIYHEHGYLEAMKYLEKARIELHGWFI